MNWRSGCVYLVTRTLWANPHFNSLRSGRPRAKSQLDGGGGEKLSVSGMPDSAAPDSRSNSDPNPDAPLAIAGFQGTPDEIERQWFEQVYKGRGDSMKQLTWRAVVMGTVLGAVLSTTNIYIGLKAGWVFGVVITASILSFSLWQILLKLRLARTPMTILENNCMQSTASAAGYSTGTTLVSAFTAFVMINNTSIPLPEMLAWVFFTAVLGITPFP